MSDEALRNEIKALRDEVARLEADRARPVPVEVEGFEGLRQLSHAIENKNLDAFLLDRGIPDRWFWGTIILFFLFFVGLFVVGFFQAHASLF
jgi:hypothetical protein